MFPLIHTDRLILRPVQPDDATALFERRNEPEVARLQDWSIPFPRENAEQVIAGSGAMDGPADDDWWMLTVADADTGEIFGDLALRLEDEGRIAQIGYTFASAHWGRGYATEAVEGLVVRLFETPEVTRVWASLHPDNLSSAMVLERTGFVFEGRMRLSSWVGDENTDDLIYGMTRKDWQAWTHRSRRPPQEVHLVEVTGDNLRAVYDTSTHKSQETFVAPNPRSLSQALVPGDFHGNEVEAWFRAIEADGEIAGFVMLALIDHPDEEPYLWRLLIDRMHQRRGIASRALDLVEDQVRAWGEPALVTSWVPGRGSPEPFYLARGYEPTGEIEDGETVGRKVL